MNTHPFHYTSVHFERSCGHFREKREIVTMYQSARDERRARGNKNRNRARDFSHCMEVNINRQMTRNNAEINTNFSTKAVKQGNCPLELKKRAKLDAQLG